MRRVTTLVAVAAIGLVGVAVVGPGRTPPSPSSPPSAPDDDGARSRPVTVVQATGAGLAAFDGCDALTDHLRASFAAHPWGKGVHAMGGMAGDDTVATAEDSAEAAAPAARSMASGTSDTNVQVAGVDELDLVETDGRRVFTVVDGRLHVVDVSGPVPTGLADVAVDVEAEGAEGELLLHEGRLLVVTRSWRERGLAVPQGREVASDMAVMGTPVTTLHLFDVTADEPVELGRLEVEGELVAGRGVDGTAHLVIAHRPQPIGIAAMEEVWATQTEDGMVRRMQQALATTSTHDWLPRLRHRGDGGTITTASSVGCADVARPVDTDDTSMLQVVTIDTHGADAVPEATTAVLTDARSVTATATELVVATPVWQPLAQPQPFTDDAARDMVAPAPARGTTRLHLFDLGPDGATHRASGEVPGMLLNQFSMSLHGGDLRVATTAGDQWAGDSESGVTVLRPTGDRLETIGSVGGLGRGETIHAVRFLGDRAYVVTFRQTDPLYTIDLADPTTPEVTGELKITGYSAYLHPLGQGRLLGVGQEATLEGRTTGTQVSIFDVADPVAPTRVSQVLLPGAGSEAEWDHHAVLVHDDLVVLPYERWDAPTPERPEGYESAAIVIERDGDALQVRGTVARSDGHPGEEMWQRSVRRALVVDGRLVTVSRSGVAVHDPATLATTGELPLDVRHG